MTEQISELKQRLVVGRKQDGRSCYDPQAKRELIEAGLQPGVSVAKLALAHGINANQLHKWRRQFPVARTTVVVRAPSRIPVAVIPDEAAPSSVDDSPPAVLTSNWVVPASP